MLSKTLVFILAVIAALSFTALFDGVAAVGYHQTLAQATGLVELLPSVASGATAVILFVIWWYTFHRANQMHDQSKKESLELFKMANTTSLELFKKSEQHANELFNIALQKHDDLNNRLIEVLSNGHRIQENLTGVLSRLETKIDKIKD